MPTVSARVHRGKVDVDLMVGAFGLRGEPGGDGCGAIRDVEKLTVDNEFGTASQRLRWFVRGTSADETVVLRHGGSVRATMAGGDDRVTASSGDDTLKGGPGDDRLFGGDGKDVAMGGNGTDTCRQVEFHRGCELPADLEPIPGFRPIGAWLLSPVMPRTSLLFAALTCARSRVDRRTLGRRGRLVRAQEGRMDDRADLDDRGRRPRLRARRAGCRSTAPRAPPGLA